MWLRGMQTKFECIPNALFDHFLQLTSQLAEIEALETFGVVSPNRLF